MAKVEWHPGEFGPRVGFNLALPAAVAHWSLTSSREKLVKIGAKIFTHARYVTFQMAEVAVPSRLFGKILRLIDGLQPQPVPA